MARILSTTSKMVFALAAAGLLSACVPAGPSSSRMATNWEAVQVSQVVAKPDAAGYIGW